MRSELAGLARSPSRSSCPSSWRHSSGSSADPVRLSRATRRPARSEEREAFPGIEGRGPRAEVAVAVAVAVVAAMASGGGERRYSCRMAWPKVDPDVRRRGFEKLRRDQVLREARLTPAVRVARADELRAFALTFDQGRPASTRSADEPVEILLRMGGRARRGEV